MDRVKIRTTCSRGLDAGGCSASITAGDAQPVHTHSPTVVEGAPSRDLRDIAKKMMSAVMMTNLNGYDAYGQQYFNDGAVVVPHGYGCVKRLEQVVSDGDGLGATPLSGG